MPASWRIDAPQIRDWQSRNRWLLVFACFMLFRADFVLVRVLFSRFFVRFDYGFSPGRRYRGLRLRGCHRGTESNEQSNENRL